MHGRCDPQVGKTKQYTFLGWRRTHERSSAACLVSEGLQTHLWQVGQNGVSEGRHYWLLHTSRPHAVTLVSQMCAGIWESLVSCSREQLLLVVGRSAAARPARSAEAPDVGKVIHMPVTPPPPLSLPHHPGMQQDFHYD